MALMEIDQVAVNEVDWKAAQAGDEAAKGRIKKTIDSLVLYMHAMPVSADETVVTLRELEQAHVLSEITVTKVGP